MKKILTICSFLGACLVAQAVVISSFSITATDTAGSVNATTQDSNIGAVTATRGAGMANISLSGTWAHRSFGYASVDIPAALAGGDYIEFQINPNSGFQVSVDSFSFNFKHREGGLDWGFALYSSIDGYASALASQTISAPAANTITPITFGTLGIANQTSAVTFRLAMSENSNNNFKGGGFLDDSGNSAFSFDGSVTAVPEPSTYALIFGFSALLIAIARRKKRA